MGRHQKSNVRDGGAAPTQEPAPDDVDPQRQVREYLTTIEAARYLSLSPQFLEIARHRGVGPTYCKIGRAVRYRRSHLDEWMSSNERKPS